MECKKHHATIPKRTCIARQSVLARANKIRSKKGQRLIGNLATQYLDYRVMCENCNKGKKIYQKSLT